MKSWNDYKKTMAKPASLCDAAKEGDYELCVSLIQNGALIDEKDPRGYSPLMLACYSGHEDVARYLMEQGADINSTDAAGNSVLMGVCFKGYTSLAQCLIDAGANKDHKNNGGQSALDVATMFGRSEIVVLLTPQ